MKYRTILLLLCTAAIALLLAACGDDDNGGSATATAAAGTSTPSAAASGAFFDCTALHPGSTPQATGFPATVTDGAGTSVTINSAPAKIASLDAAHTEILYAIGAADQVTAVDNTSDCPAAAASLPKVDAYNPSVEAITALHPDLVVLAFDTGDIAAALRNAGLAVLVLPSPSDINGAYDDIELLGKATGHPGEADALVTSMSDAVRALGQVNHPTPGPKIYHELDNTYFSVGPGSFLEDMYKTLGATNIADATNEAYPQLSSESIIADDPDVIILADEGSGESAATVAARPGWSAISAVTNHRIYTINPDIVSRPGPRIIDALRQLSDDLYGQAGG